jgi:hypothetical protein
VHPDKFVIPSAGNVDDILKDNPGKPDIPFGKLKRLQAARRLK